MTDADRVYARFPDFIKEYIYAQGWSELREIQLAAADVIFNTDDNLLLSSSTASGKTEAAFFPIISDIVEDPSHKKSVDVLYIAPLKSLINDQFVRLYDLLESTGIALTHWHGDVGASHKSKLLKSPEGILQITPESLESMLINRSNDVPRLFGSLKYVVIDEIHALIGQDRGNQVLCLLSRLARLIGHSPRRVGLSATLGDLTLASEWLEREAEETRLPPFHRKRLSNGASVLSIFTFRIQTKRKRLPIRYPKRGARHRLMQDMSFYTMRYTAKRHSFSLIQEKRPNTLPQPFVR